MNNNVSLVTTKGALGQGIKSHLSSEAAQFPTIKNKSVCTSQVAGVRV